MIRNLLRQYERPVRFLLVGGGITIVYSLLTAGLITSAVSMPRVGASFIASVVTIPISYVAHKRITYGDTTPSTHRFSRFVLLGAANLFLNVGGMTLTALLRWPFWIAIFAGWVIVPAANFLINTLWVFRARRLLTLENEAQA